MAWMKVITMTPCFYECLQEEIKGMARLKETVLESHMFVF